MNLHCIFRWLCFRGLLCTAPLPALYLGWLGLVEDASLSSWVAEVRFAVALSRSSTTIQQPLKEAKYNSPTFEVWKMNIIWPFGIFTLLVFFAPDSSLSTNDTKKLVTTRQGDVEGSVVTLHINRFVQGCYIGFQYCPYWP